jgi:regulator of protease activity HflC (stomatin/prohibitin superfamily)
LSDQALFVFFNVFIRKIKMKRILISAVTALALMVTMGCSQINTGNVGVESTLGQVRKEIMPSGVYFTLFKRVTEVSAKESVLSLNDLKPQTSDKISLEYLDIDIYVQIDPAHAPDIMTRWPGDLVKVKGEDGIRVGSNYVTRKAQEQIYNAVAKFGSATIHTERNNLVASIITGLQKDLDDSAGKGWFFVRSANVRALLTDKSLDANIKAAANAQFELQKKEIQIRVATAEAARQKIEALGDAEAIRVRAAAVSAQGGSEYVQLQAIAKWDGKLPVTQAGGATPFLNLK